MFREFSKRRNDACRIPKDLAGLGQGLLVLYGDFGVGVCFWNREGLLLEQFYVFLHAPLGLIKTVFNRVTDARETFKIGRIKFKKGWIICCLDHQRVVEINHDISLYLTFKPAALRMALQVLTIACHLVRVQRRNRYNLVEIGRSRNRGHPVVFEGPAIGPDKTHGDGGA